MLKETIGDKLRKLREENEMPLRTVAALLEIDVSNDKLLFFIINCFTVSSVAGIEQEPVLKYVPFTIPFSLR